MSTLILSDLHLGSLSRSDLLRRPELRAPLLEAAEGAERVVLLGDVLELRHGPMREAMEASRPFFEELGRVLAGRELVLVAGNHDHALIEPWLARRGEAEEPPPLALEQVLEPGEASGAYRRISAWCAPARTLVAYPGLWVRPDVYATHGHYLDLHLTVPTLERLSVGVMTRVLGRPPASFDRVEHYEGAGAPVFAWRDAVARDKATGNALNGIATLHAWEALGGGGRSNGRPTAGRSISARAIQLARTRAFVAAFPLAVALLNRLGVGPLRADISTGELRRAGLRAMGEVAERLSLGDAHVVFGHTHRTGPLAGDDAEEWRGRGGARLINTGSWTVAELFLTSTPGESPYWPGGCVLVEGSGPPRLLRLLQDRTRVQLAPRYAGRQPRPAGAPAESA